MNVEHLHEANLSRAILSGAILSGANLRGADLSEALLWLAGLEKSCTECTAKDGIPCNCLACHGTGKVGVLDLREPCPGVRRLDTGERLPCMILRPDVWNRLGGPCEGDIDPCGSTGWVPKQGEAALHQAMHKDGWNLEVLWVATDYREYTGDYTEPFIMMAGERHVTFWREDGRYPSGKGADDWLAALQAMQAAGYA